MASSMRTLLGVFVVISAFNKLLWVDGANIEVTVQTVEVKTPMHLPGVYNIRLLRATKFNRTTTVINTEMSLEIDLDDSYSFQADLYYSRLGDSNYQRAPAQVAKDSLCKTVEKFRSMRILKEIEAASNIPKGFPCPFPKGNYSIKNYLASSESLDAPYVPDGLWRAEMMFYDKMDKVIFLANFVVRSETKLFG